MRRLPPLNALKAFEAVARLSSITEAAAELSVSHSSVSQQIKLIEGYFGQKLFIRRGRGIEPTQAALVYLEEIRACFDRIAVSSEQLAQQGQRHGITLNATPSFALRWLIPKTSEFQLANPTIDLRVTTSTSDEITHLKEPYDLIFRRDAMVRHGHLCARLLDDSQTPVMAPALLEQHNIKEPRDLANLTLLHMRSRPDAWEKWFQNQNITDIDTGAGPFFDHFFLSLQAAITGHGVAIGSRVLIEDDLEAGRLVAPFQEQSIEGPGFHVLYRSEIADYASGRIFLKWLSKTTGVDLL